MSESLGRAIVRKYQGPAATDTIDVASIASVDVTSEHELYPIDHVFDGRSGPGGSCWSASKPGVQTILLRFEAPTDLGSVTIECEERGITCTQQVEVAAWGDDGAAFEAPARVLAFAPYGAQFHRETWDVARRVTHVRVRVTPSPLARTASLTSILLR